MIAIIDYGAGNLRSIERALMHHGATPVITSDPNSIAEADALIFPGVGNARAAMNRLHESGIADAITTSVDRGTPLLGVCLGMQLMFEDQEEGPTTGLGLLRGRGIALPETRKSPHMGWNTVEFRQGGPLGHLDAGSYYFVHSFIVETVDPQDVAAETSYGVTFPSVVARDNVWGMQFHPEKSGELGIALVGEWLSILNRRTRHPERSRGISCAAAQPHETVNRQGQP